MIFRVIPLFISAAAGTVIEGQVYLPLKLNIPADYDKEELSELGRVMVLSNGEEVARTKIDREGKFSIPGIKKGNYKVYFSNPFLRIEPVTLEVSSGTVSAFSLDLEQPDKRKSLAYPLNIIPSAFQSPYTPEEEFNAFQFLKNPMVLMMLAMVVLVWLMPKLQGNVSPEDMAEMRRDLEQDSGFAASMLKKMMPADPSAGGIHNVGFNIPSLSSNDKKDK
jgi:hypothetical protein